MTLKIRLRPFRTHTRSRTLDEPTRDPERVRSVAGELLAEFELDAPVRLLGVGVSGLVPEGCEAAGAALAGRVAGARPQRARWRVGPYGLNAHWPESLRSASSREMIRPWPTGTG